MKNFSASVIVPVYNSEKYIARCIESILNQTYENFELILIDDGSTDSSGAVCDRYAASDGRIKVIHQNNMGVSAARNTALKIAEKEFVTFVDSDDYIDRDYLKIFSEKVSEETDICVCMYKWIDKEKNEIYVCRFVESELLVAVDEKFDFCNFQCNNACCGKLYRRSLLFGIQFDVRYFLCEDSLFFAQAAVKSGKILYIPDCLYYYEIHNGSLSQSFLNERKMTALSVWNKIIRLFENYPVSYKSCKIQYMKISKGFYRESFYLPDSGNAYRRRISSALKNTQIRCSDLNPKMKILYLLMKRFRLAYDALLFIKIKSENLKNLLHSDKTDG